MNGKQYNNVIDWTLTHDETAQSADSLTTARAVFKNMGVALPQGDLEQIAAVLATNDFMYWRSCTLEEAQGLADAGVAVIGINDSEIVVINANDPEEEIESTTASIFTRTTDTLMVSEYSTMSFYAYNAGSSCTTGGGCNTTVTRLFFNSAYNDIPVNSSGYFPVSACPTSVTNPVVRWESSNTTVATVGYYSGVVHAHTPGTAIITARSASDPQKSASFELWVRGYTPVFLIHGRTDNSFGCWGATNSIFVDPLNPDDKNNNHFDPSITALSEGTYRALYTSKGVQDIRSYALGLPIKVDGEIDNNFTVPGIFNGQFKDGAYTTTHPEGGNLAYYLSLRGYTENVNLFAFNYPNEDAVVHSAKKFEEYIKNLIQYVRESGSAEMKACFYRSRAEYNAEKFKINLVGHSMGGLVSRYYIENLGHDEHVDKLITICTPHWGSDLADTSCNTGSLIFFDLHKLCDHDLRPTSQMFGGSESTELDCNAITNECYNKTYTLTGELLYNKPRLTRYYAIVGIDYNSSDMSDNNFGFEISNTHTTYSQLSDAIQLATNNCMCITDFTPSVGDNVVSFLSQIGWTNDSTELPNKKIMFEKIFINVDSNGGNVVWNHFHGKMPHRDNIMEKVREYLFE